MGQILVRNLDNAVLDALREEAAANGTSLEQLARDVLTQASYPQRKRRALERIREIHAGMSPSTLDPVALIREDRDHR